MEHIRHMLWSTTPAYLVSIIVYVVLGFRFDGVIGGEQYESLLNGLASTFNFNVLLLIPPSWYLRWCCRRNLRFPLAAAFLPLPSFSA